MRFLAVGFLFLQGAMAWAQVLPVPPIREPQFPPQVKQYLGLTDEQVVRISALNAALAQFQSAKTARQVQVQIEIAQETGRENLDAMALGLRYLELEAIRRELERERTKVVAAVQALLTGAQKVKVAALQQVMRDYPTACAGVAANAVPPVVVLPVSRLVPLPLDTDPFTPVTGAILGPLSLPCGAAVPTFVRAGDFSEPQP
jgi:hypothetical protein